MVFFYRSIDSTSKSLASQYAAAASQLNVIGMSVVMAKFDVDKPDAQDRENQYNISNIPSFVWFSNGKPRNINLSSMDWSNSQDIVKWVQSSGAPVLAPMSPDNCRTTRLGTLCMTIPAYAFYILLAAAIAHVLQALAWVVVSKRSRLFSLPHFAAVLFVPVFGLFCWIPLCRVRESDQLIFERISIKMLDARI
jgi:hypothetical protein